MVAASKPTLLQQLGGRTCREVVHPWTESCWRGPLPVALSTMAGTCRFMLPIYAAQVLVGGWRPDVTTAALSLVRSMCFGTCATSGIVGFHCLCRFVLRGYRRSTLLFWPSFFAGLSVYLEDHKRKETVVFYFCCWVLEWLFRRLEARHPPLGTRAARTLLFAAANAALMWTLRRASFPRTLPIFWFFRPARPPRDAERREGCSHQGTCWTHGATLSVKYLSAGVALQLARSLIGRWQAGALSKRAVGVGSMLVASLCSRNSLGLFLGAYTALYQVVSCGLCQLRGGDRVWHALPAGAVSGAAFCLHPNLTVALAAVTTLLQVMVARWVDRRLLEPTFALCLAILVCVWFAERHNCPPAFKAMADIVSPSLADGLYKRVWGNQ